MSTSLARIEANRVNARQSTGPRTPEGMQRSAQNALRHGLTSQKPVLPTEDPQAYQEFCREFIAGLNPAGMLEQHLAQALADIQWRLQRCRSIEQSILDQEPGAAQIDSLNKFSLYEHRLMRNFQTTLKQFLDLKAERKQREEQDLKDAAKIMKHLRSKQIPFEPAEYGFVFSNAQIDTWMRRCDGLEEASQAAMMEFNRRFFGRTAAAAF